MIYLRSISLKNDIQHENTFPFTIPAIRTLKQIEFCSPITIFVGENGSGKSTLLEAIGAGIGSITIGSEDLRTDKALHDVRKLSHQLKFVHSRKPKRGFFFRAEDFIGFSRKINDTARMLEELEQEYAESLSGSGRLRAMGLCRKERYELYSRYGTNLDANSHGESFLKVFQSRMIAGGLYLLDEPETPLSPTHQLTLMSLIKEMLTQNCQFIIATHSPFLMALPDSIILNFDDAVIERTDYDNVEHVILYKSFLNNKERFLKNL